MAARRDLSLERQVSEWDLGLYVLDGHVPRRVATVREWGDARAAGGWRVAKDDVGDVFISTMFLGIDHRFDDAGPPLLFETMIFGGPDDEETWHYSTWDDAVAGHAVAVKRQRKHEISS